ncbi:hypothetical protein CJF32_00006699 [Rutstroemia sp. NJR-2017a WRK4]|nr:hypothetical protein CJF32_00006699 [Rutstroemia sp. NJR-2017a WRK4]
MDGTPYVDTAGCALDGGSTRRRISDFGNRGPTLTGLAGSLSAALGTIVYYFDDFDALYTCVSGKTNSVVAPGLCG